MLRKNEKQLEVKIKKIKQAGGVFMVGMLLCASPSLAQTASNSSISIREKQIVENNKNLRNAIEQNQQLTQRYEDLESQMQALKDKNEEHSVRYDDLKRERDSLAKSIENIRNTNRKYAQEIESLEKQIQEIQLAKKQEIEDVRAEAVAKSSEVSSEQLSSVGNTSEEVKKMEEKTLDLLSKVDAFNEEDEALRKDAARAHYNMGNIYYEKGEYEIAAREFYQAVSLMPDDPDAHYNLALVSGEYLNDQKTALEHYKMYLYLKPDAKDRDLVREKIVHTQLILGSKIDSPIDTVK